MEMVNILELIKEYQSIVSLTSLNLFLLPKISKIIPVNVLVEMVKILMMLRIFQVTVE